jgi:GxxExxY protein
LDFICFDRLLIELKALAQITPVDHAQMISYLKAARAERGLILNFGGRSLGIKRLMFSEALHLAVSETDDTRARE